MNQAGSSWTRNFALSWVGAATFYAALALCPSEGFAQTEVIGNISSSRTWTADNSPYLLTGDVKVLNQATLTIEPGVEVRFATTDALGGNESFQGVELIIEGAINVQGTVEAPVVFRLNSSNTNCGENCNNTGVRLAPFSLQSTIRHMVMDGFSVAIDVRSVTAPVIEDVAIRNTITAVSNSSSSADTVLTRVTTHNTINGLSHTSAGGVTLIESRVLARSVVIGGQERLTFPDRGDADQLSSLRYYRAYHTNLDLLGARDFCMRRGADLAGFNTQGELDDFSGLGSLQGLGHDGDRISNSCNPPGPGWFIYRNENDCRFDDWQAPRFSSGLRPWYGLVERAGRRSRDQFVDGSLRVTEQPLARSFDGPTSDTCSPRTAMAVYRRPSVFNDANLWSADRPLNEARRFVCGRASHGYVRPALAAEDVSPVVIMDSEVMAERVLLKGSSVSMIGSRVEGVVRISSGGAVDVVGGQLMGDVAISTREEVTLLEVDVTDSHHANLSGLFLNTPQATVQRSMIRWDYGGSFSDCNTAETTRSHGVIVRGGVVFENNVVQTLYVSTDRQSRHPALRVYTGINNNYMQDDGVSNVLIRNNTFVDNAAGIYVEGGPADIRNNLIMRQLGHNWDGAGIHAGPVADLTLANNDVWNHNPNYQGVEPDEASVSQNPLFAKYPCEGLSCEWVDTHCRTRSFKGVDYAHCFARRNRQQAQELCQRFGGDLVQIEDEDENRFLSELADRENVYIGLNDVEREGRYQWPDGTQVLDDVYANWLPGQPTDSTAENCVVMSPAGQWSDVDCAGSREFVCEGVSPERSVFALSSNSPLVDIGTCFNGAQEDFLGTPRPFDGNLDNNAQCDIGAFEFGPESLVVRADGPFLTGRDVQLRLIGQTGGLEYEIEDAEWTIDPAAGRLQLGSLRFRPAPVPGAHPAAIRASFGGLTATLDVNVECGCYAPGLNRQGERECNDVPECYDDWNCDLGAYCSPVEVGIIPDPVRVSAGQSLPLRYGGADTYGFVSEVEGPFVFNLNFLVGSIDENGVLTAGDAVGTYEEALQVTWNNTPKRFDVIILPGNPERLVVSAEEPTVETTQELQYVVEAFDADDNPIQNPPVLWSIADGVDATIDPNTGLVTAGCTPGVYPAAVTARYGETSASADLEIVTGGALPAALTVTPPVATVSIGDTTVFRAIVTDTCGTELPSDNVVFSTSNPQIGEIEAQTGRFTAGCSAGNFAGAIIATAGDFVATAGVNIVEGAAAELIVTPQVVDAAINSSTDLTVRGLDNCGNLVDEPVQVTTLIPGAEIEFVSDTQRRLRISCAPTGDYPAGVVARVGEQTVNIPVSVRAGEATALTLSPSSAEVPAGGNLQFTALAVDACDNDVSSRARFSASAGGTIDQGGLFTASCAQGTFRGAVVATLDGYQSSADITVVPGRLQTLEVQPNPVVVQAGATQTLTATPLDGCGQRLNGQVVWSSGQSGAITQGGVLTATTVAGVYEGDVVAAIDNVTTNITVMVSPGPAVSVAIQPSTLVLAVDETADLVLEGQDRFNNRFDIEGAAWSAEQGAGTVTLDGFFRAGRTAGPFEAAVTGSFQNLEATLDVTVLPGEPTRVSAIDPPNVTLLNRQSQQFEVEVLDAYGNLTDEVAAWEVVADGGSISDTGFFTANDDPGFYENTIRASFGDSEQFASVNITAAQPARIEIEPTLVSVEVGSSVDFNATVYDELGEVIDISPVWFVPQESGVEINAEGLLTVRCDAELGRQNALVTARVQNVEVTADVEIRTGPTTFVEMGATNVTLELLEQAALSASPKDDCGNTTRAPVVWELVGAGPTLSPSGVFTASTTAGVFVVRAVSGEVFGQTAVEVLPGDAVRVVIDPGQANVAVNGSASFTVEATDRYDNVWTPFDARWSAQPEVGVVDANGNFVAGPNVGSYPQGVQAEVDGRLGFAAVTVSPGPAADLRIVPATPTVQAGQTFRFEASVVDEFGNARSGQSPTFNCSPDVGSCTPDGVLTAGKVPGVFVGAVTANAGEFTASADVTVVAGSPASIILTPSSQTVPMGSSLLFDAVVFDQAEAPVQDAAVAWSADAQLGTIDATGRLTVGTTAGSYDSGVVASVGSIRAVAAINVPSDFDDDGIPDKRELEYGLDPTDDSDALQDADGDGVTNRDEILAGDNPLEAGESVANPSSASAESGCHTAPGQPGRGWAALMAALALMVWRRRADHVV